MIIPIYTLKQLFVVIVLFFFFPFISSGKVKFIETDFRTAIQQSKKENKSFFVMFTASWCTTCKVMEKSADNHQELGKYIEDYFIPIKADIEKDLGKFWQVKFRVEAIPTLLIFSPEGKIISRKIGGLSGTKFLSILRQFEIPNSILAFTKSKQENSSLNKKFIPKNYEPNRVSPNKTRTQNTNTFQTDKHHGGTAKNSSTNINPKDKFGVQVGIYSSLKNANQKVDQIKNKVDRNLMILPQTKNGKIIYKVIVGEFRKEKDANNLVGILSSKGITGHLIKL